MKKSSLLLFLVIPAVGHAALISDFNTPGSFGENFRNINTDATAAPVTQSGGFVSTISAGTTVNASVYTYDTTPTDGTVRSTFSGGSTVSFNIRATTADSSFGVYIINAATGTVGALALFNFDVGGTAANDTLRLWTGGNPTTAGTGAQFGGTVTGNSGLNAGGAFGSFVLSYTQGAAGVAVLNLTVGGITTGSVTLGAGTFYANYEIGIRAYDRTAGDAGGVDYDDFNVTPIPEPSALALAAIAGIGFFRRRR